MSSLSALCLLPLCSANAVTVAGTGCIFCGLLAGRINSSFSASWKRIPCSAKDTDSSIYFLCTPLNKSPFGRSSPQFYSGTVSCLVTYSNTRHHGKCKGLRPWPPHGEVQTPALETFVCTHKHRSVCVHTLAPTLKIIHHNIWTSEKNHGTESLWMRRNQGNFN